IQLTDGGSTISAAGQLNLAKMSITRTNQTTPPLDLRAEYNVSVDKKASRALLRGLTLTGTQKGNTLLRAELTQPMNLAWGSVTNVVPDSALNVTINHLDLADWKPFVGDVAPTGDVNGKLTFLSKQNGTLFVFDLDSHLDNLTAVMGSNRITQASVALQG